MLDDVVAEPGEHTAAELLAAHTQALVAVIAAVGVDAAAAATEVPRGVLQDVAAGDVDTAGDLDLRAVGTLRSLEEGAPDASTVVAEAREALLLGMTTGVVDVDVLAGDLSLDLDAREVQAMLEGRHPMSLRQFAGLQAAIGRRAR